jgi:hypothetical protein
MKIVNDAKLPFSENVMVDLYLWLILPRDKLMAISGLEYDHDVTDPSIHHS